MEPLVLHIRYKHYLYIRGTYNYTSLQYICNKCIFKQTQYVFDRINMQRAEEM